MTDAVPAAVTPLWLTVLAAVLGLLAGAAAAWVLARWLERAAGWLKKLARKRREVPPAPEDTP